MTVQFLVSDTSPRPLLNREAQIACLRQMVKDCGILYDSAVRSNETAEGLMASAANEEMANIADDVDEEARGKSKGEAVKRDDKML